LQPVDLHGLIMEVVQGIESPLQQKGLACRLSLSAPRHIVNGDPTRLRQIFLNLLDNAMKFTPSGGTITIETAEGQERDSILICVRDSGIGIEPGNLERIFDAFEQATPSSPRRYGGLGLGLAIVRGLVEAHGGSIRAQNPESGGAEFIFDLHLTSRPVVEMEPCRVQEARGMRILLVEDHADTRETLMRLLERRGHTVSVAKGVSDARELLEGSAFDLVISDIGLPDGSGLDIPAVARSGGYAVSCIALSGFGTEDDIQKSFRAGFSHHLTKPVEMNVLDAAIADLRGRNRSS
jgi:CheY-like chemotaxis protein